MKQTQRSLPTKDNYRRTALAILQLASTEGLRKGDQLRASRIAMSMQISRTPIHAALQLLAQEDIVSYRKHSGFYLKMPAGEAIQQFQKSVSDETTYPVFARDALNWGDGHAISVTGLSRRYQISRHAAEQLVELASSQGWLVKSAGHSWIIKLGITTERDYARLYRFRKTIEPAAILEPEFEPHLNELERLASIQTRLVDGEYQRISAVDLFEINRELHETIVSWSNNQFYLDALRRSNERRRLIEYSKVLQSNNVDGFAREHLKILGVIRGADYKEAALQMTLHLDGALQAKT